MSRTGVGHAGTRIALESGQTRSPGPEPPAMNIARIIPTDLMQLWTTAVASGDPDVVTALYDPQDGVLWGTVSQMRRDTPAHIRDYFVHFLAKKDLTAIVYHPHVRQVGDVVIDTGYYTFQWTDDDGHEQSLSARYSFVWANRGDGWRILDHHSSAVPT